MTAFGLLATLFLAFEVGYGIGKRASGEGDPRAGGQLGAIQGAIIGLLALLLALTFAAAASRFFERQDLIVTEANAIGTAYLRADLLSEPAKTNLRTALQRYTEHRIEVSRNLRQGFSAEAAAEIERLHGEIWSAASAGVAARPEAMLGVLPPVNDVIDLHSTRVAAGRKHLPWPVMTVLIGCSLLSMAVIGYCSGISGHRRAPLTYALTILIGLSLWITIDLDRPRAGLLQLSDAPLHALKFSSSS